MVKQSELSQDMVLVLLAAGSSRRFQGNKLLYPFQGKPLYRHLTDQIKELSPEIFTGKVVVTQYEEIAERLGKEGFTVVKNQEPELGISHSIGLAIEKIRSSALGETVNETRQNLGAAVCFAVCDQPFLCYETIEKLIVRWRQSGKGLGCLGYRGELGNPAVFAAHYLDELLMLTGDVGGKKIIRRHSDDLFVLDVEDEIELWDIDRRTDAVTKKGMF